MSLERIVARSTLIRLVLASALCATVGYSNGSAQPAAGSAWIANGATACGKYLTPEVVGVILIAKADKAQRLDANFMPHRQHLPLLERLGHRQISEGTAAIVGAHTMTGIGDGAYWNEAGAISAVKGHDRGCDINVLGAPGATKIHSAELGQKLGAICNQLFALP